MCQKCIDRNVKNQSRIDAIDNNRQAFSQLIDKIHAEMGDPVIVFAGEEAKAKPYIRAGVANYVVAFLTGELEHTDMTIAAIAGAHEGGNEAGYLYAKVRKMQAN